MHCVKGGLDMADALTDEALVADAGVVVVGSGIVGAACARALARAGVNVWVVERDGAARGTSGAGEGNLVLWDRGFEADFALAQWCASMWPVVADALAEETGTDVEYCRKGSLMVISEPEGLASAEQRCSWLGARGVNYEWLSDTELRTLEPGLTGRVARAALFPDDAQIEPRAATGALLHAARRYGATVLEHEEVIGLVDDADCVVVTTARRELRAQWVVMAAGVWTPALGRMLGARVPVAARKGHVVVLGGASVRVNHKVMEASYFKTVESDDKSLLVAAVVESTRAGTILLGSSRVVVDTLERTSEMSVVSKIVRRALEFYPGLGSARILRTYAGLRPMSSDHVPIIGQLPKHPRVLLATGHEGGGVMMSIGTAEIITGMVVGNVSPVALEPFSPGRFEIMGRP